MSAETDNNFKKKLRKFVFTALKTTVKATIVYFAYFFLWRYVAPISMMIPGLQQLIETFLTVYVVLMIAGDLTSGTVFQHVLNVAKALFVIVYLVFSLNNGIFGFAFGGVSLVVDLRLFLVIAMLLGLLGLAKSVMQTINYVNEKAELVHI